MITKAISFRAFTVVACATLKEILRGSLFSAAWNDALNPGPPSARTTGGALTLGLKKPRAEGRRQSSWNICFVRWEFLVLVLEGV